VNTTLDSPTATSAPILPTVYVTTIVQPVNGTDVSPVATGSAPLSSSTFTATITQTASPVVSASGTASTLPAVYTLTITQTVTSVDNVTVTASTAPSVTLAPILSSALANLTSAISTDALTSIVPSASINPILSSYIANLTSALPSTVQPTGAAPTALPSTVSNGTAVQPVQPPSGMTLQDLLNWLGYLIAHSFPGSSYGNGGMNATAADNSTGTGISARAHARDLGQL